MYKPWQQQRLKLENHIAYRARLVDLAPVMSEEQLRVHHSKDHQAYVNGANGIFERLDKARESNADVDIKAALKELSWNIGGCARTLLAAALFTFNLTAVKETAHLTFTKRALSLF